MSTYFWDFSVLKPVDSFEEFLTESTPSVMPSVFSIFNPKTLIIAGCINKHIKFGGIKHPGRYRLIVTRTGSEVRSKLVCFV